MNAWFFTNTFYGTWLPGDARGSVTSVRSRRADDPSSPARTEHDRYGTPFESAMPSLERTAAERLKGPPISIDVEKALILLAQFQETAAHQNWRLLCMSIMWNHVHWIAVISESANAAKVLADLKAYGSRALNRRYGKPRSGTWWTSKGSKRLLTVDTALSAAIDYVLNRQPNPLLTWAADGVTSGGGGGCRRAPGADASGSR